MLRGVGRKLREGCFALPNAIVQFGLGHEDDGCDTLHEAPPHRCVMQAGAQSVSQSPVDASGGTAMVSLWGKCILMASQMACGLRSFPPVGLAENREPRGSSIYGFLRSRSY